MEMALGGRAEGVTLSFEPEVRATLAQRTATNLCAGLQSADEHLVYRSSSLGRLLFVPASDTVQMRDEIEMQLEKATDIDAVAYFGPVLKQIPSTSELEHEFDLLVAYVDDGALFRVVKGDLLFDSLLDALLCSRQVANELAM